MVPKFKAYLKIHKKIVNVREINYKYKEIAWENGKYTEVDNFEDVEFLQSTRLKDKNGVEIYEGDILKINEMKGLVQFGRYTDDEYIIYGLDGWLFSEMYHNRYIDTPLTEYVLDSYYEIEIIGNKFKNKELLEDDNE